MGRMVYAYPLDRRLRKGCEDAYETVALEFITWIASSFWSYILKDYICKEFVVLINAYIVPHTMCILCSTVYMQISKPWRLNHHSGTCSVDFVSVLKRTILVFRACWQHIVYLCCPRKPQTLFSITNSASALVVFPAFNTFQTIACR